MLYKYPRTPHLPWSLGKTTDDKTLLNCDHFQNSEIVVTIKMDGENTSMYRDFIHARSLSYSRHESRSWVKQFWETIRDDIPPNFRICGENMYAKHSIFYSNLKSYFYAFSVWNLDYCLDWNETLEWLELLNITPVNVIYRGVYDENYLIHLSHSMNLDENEGYVIRKINGFNYCDFGMNVAKFVRKNHVQTDDHWFYDKITPNKIQ